MSRFMMQLHVLSVLEPDWCDRCLLPSVERCVVAVSFDGLPHSVGEWSRCGNGCDDEIVEVAGG